MKVIRIGECTYCGHQWRFRIYDHDDDPCPKCKDTNIIIRKTELVDYDEVKELDYRIRKGRPDV